ncbi:MAG TPA: LysR family transcriptional regulator [Devosiaceae bacterium]|jgi:LysR family nitrogen assimilation transcriptional regulator
MNLRQLRYFVKVVEEGNISRAAKLLYVAQPSLGVHIGHLEAELGVQLLLRHSRGVTPTDAGRLLHERAIDILQRVDAIKREIRADADSEGRPFVVGFPPSTMNLLGPDLLAVAGQYAPEILLELVEDRSQALVEALDSGEGHIDVAIGYNVEESPKLMRTPIFEEELLYVASPAFFNDAAPVQLSEILKGKLAIAGGRGIIRELVRGEADRLSQPLDLAFRVQSPSTLKALLLKGGVSSIMPYGSMAAELEAGVLESRRIVDRPLYWTLYFVSAASNPYPQSPVVERLLKDISESLAGKLGELVRPISN